MSRRILLLSAYDAVSHRQWRTTLATLFPEFQWTQLSLPARHFSWRVRGNSLSWGIPGRPELQRHYDLLIVTSLVDLASLRGFCPALTRIPTLVYFHENQFAYPYNQSKPKNLTDSLNPPTAPNPGGRSAKLHDPHLDAAMVSLYTALCADRLVFNSAYNRQTFLQGLEKLLARLPDHVPSDLMHRLAMSEVLPVPLQLASEAEPANNSTAPDVLQVVWNHRWEYDKGPALLLALVEEVVARNLPIRFHLMGQQFRQQPAEFATLTELLTQQGQRYPDRAPWIGYLTDRADYHQRLADCDVVLSTARHDFQGLAVLEGCALGCTPLCPDDLVYPEYLDRRFLYPSPGKHGITASVAGMLDRLTAWQPLKATGGTLPQYRADPFRAAALKESYLALFEKTWQAAD